MALREFINCLVEFLKFLERPFIRLALWVNADLFKSILPLGHVVNGPEPWHLQVHNKEFYVRSANIATLGWAESYMDNEWDCKDIAEYMTRVLREDIWKVYYHPWNRFLCWLQFYYPSDISKTRSFEVGEKHYDLGNDLYEIMLDPYMQYSCGYWRTALNLEEAQKDKMNLIANKLQLQNGMKVLDIGCGFGGMAKYLAENFGVSVTGVSISKEQVAYAREFCKDFRVEIKLLDYRDLDPKEQFDRIVSIGMLEHVGTKNYSEFFKTVASLLKPDGIFVCQTIGVNHFRFPQIEGFFDKYIFPNGILPYYRQITEAIEKRFIIEDWQNMGFDYSKTLEAWEENFERGWPEIQEKYGKRFYRMWKLYLNFATGMFRSRRAQLWQIVLSRDGLQGGYYAAR